MQQLYYAADVRSANEIEVAKPDVKPAELKLARQLIDQQTSPSFDPSSYTDELRARLQAAIDKKVEGQEISVSEAAPESAGKVIDLMEALKASLGMSKTDERKPAIAAETKVAAADEEAAPKKKAASKKK
jgi:DNA end-binding protein Ku